MKQAFLITAYNNFGHLERLIRTLDDKNVWFYIYVDAKVEVPDSLVSIRTANPFEVLHTRRVEWGDQSQIITELELFAKAYENPDIEWFHLISGTDFPLRSVQKILNFYEKAEDVDCFMEHEPIPAHLSDRMEIYHFRARRPSETGRLISMVQSKFRSLQIKLGIKRRPPVESGFRYGSNWVDLRRNAVKMLLEDNDRILNSTRHTIIANEVYKQTFLYGRGLRIVDDNLRYIDWSEKQPSPKSLGPEDFNAMMASDKLFARKFDAANSHVLREMIEATLD